MHPVLKTIHEAIQREAEASNLLEQNLRGALGLFDRKHHETLARRKDIPTAAAATAAGDAASASHGGPNDKRRRRKWVGGEGIQDYGVEIIHL